MTKKDMYKLDELTSYSEINPDQFQLIVDFLCERAREDTFNIRDRKPYVIINRANYGNPSLAVIEFEGSPSCLRIIYGDLSYRTKYVMLGARKISEYNRYIELIKKLIEIIVYHVTGEKL